MQVNGSTPLWIAARVLLYERGDDLFRHMDKALKTSGVEDIHDLRVASRRLREGLALFAPCYPPAAVNRLVKKIKQITRLLGDIRNADEAIMFWESLAGKLGDNIRCELEQLTGSFLKNRKKLLRRLHNGLQKMSPASLRDQYLRTINSPTLFTQPVNGIDLFAPLAGFAKGSIESRLADVMKILPDAQKSGEVEAQHLLRIAVKRFRYRMEILAPLVGARFAELHGVVKGYQEVLGTMHDLDVFAAIVRGQGMSTHTEQSVLQAIASQREALFGHFSGMLVSTPLETIGGEVRDVL